MPNVETVEHKPIILQPTPFEAAIQAAFKTRLGMDFLPGSINEYGMYRRPTEFADINGTTAAFQLTRFNPLVTNTPELVDTYLSLHPEEALQEDEEGFDQVSQRYAIVDRIEQQLVERYGARDPVAEVSDPYYFFKEIPVERWGELLEFVLFEDNSAMRHSIDQLRFDLSGNTVNINGKVPDVYGALRFNVRFQGVHYTHTLGHGDHLRLILPRMHARLRRRFTHEEPWSSYASPEESAHQVVDIVENYAKS